MTIKIDDHYVIEGKWLLKLKELEQVLYNGPMLTVNQSWDWANMLNLILKDVSDAEKGKNND